MMWLPHNALLVLQALYAETQGTQKAVTTAAVLLRVNGLKEERAEGEFTRGAFNDVLVRLVGEGLIDRPERGLIRPSQSIEAVRTSQFAFITNYYFPNDPEAARKTAAAFYGLELPKGSS